MKKITFLALSLLTVHLYATNYYVSNTGKVPTGTKTSNIMSSVYDVIGNYYSPGDSILFEAGQSFIGSIYLMQDGSPTNPIVISTYGQGKATIIGTGSDKCVIGGYNMGGWVFENLEITGTSAKGLDFYVDNYTSNLPLTFRNLDVHGSFTGEALKIGAWDYSYSSGYSGIQIDKCKFHDSPKGVFIYDLAQSGSFSYSHKNVKITNSEVYKISNSAIVLCGVDTGLIDYCYIHDCKGWGGDVAVWTYASANVTIQNCIIANHKTSGKDGGGIDLDGGSVNCTVQYCYTYNNYGPAGMVCDYPNSRPTKGNVFRYNISENDCRKPQSVNGDDQNSFGFINWGAGISDSYIYNNTVYLSYLPGATKKIGAYGNVRLDGYAQQPVQRCKVMNNIAQLYGTGLYNVINYVSDTTNVTYWNNAFFSSESPNYFDGGTTFNSMDSWRTFKPGQEKTQGGFTGFEADLKLLSPGNGEAVQDPSKIKSIFYYGLKSSSPCIGKGIDVKKYYNLEAGTFDFLGNANSNNGLFDLGACSYNSKVVLGIEDKSSVSSEISLYPNPSKGLVYIKAENSDQFSSIIICDMFGHQLKQILHFSSENLLDISDLPTGIYSISFESKGCVILTKKIIKI